MARSSKKPTPLLVQPVMLDVFSAPPKKSRQAIAIKAQRQRYIAASVERGIPPQVARLVCNRYSTPKKINEVLSRWTGRCHKLGVPLTDVGDSLDSSVIVTRDGQFISKLAVRFQGSFTDSELLGLCKLVYNKHHARSTSPDMGRNNRPHHDNSYPAQLSGATSQPVGEGKQSAPLGLF